MLKRAVPEKLRGCGTVWERHGPGMKVTTDCRMLLLAAASFGTFQEHKAPDEIGPLGSG